MDLPKTVGDFITYATDKTPKSKIEKVEVAVFPVCFREGVISAYK